VKVLLALTARPQQVCLVECRALDESVHRQWCDVLGVWCGLRLAWFEGQTAPQQSMAGLCGSDQ
jgi:hypothetical protein